MFGRSVAGANGRPEPRAVRVAEDVADEDLLRGTVGERDVRLLVRLRARPAVGAERFEAGQRELGNRHHGDRGSREVREPLLEVPPDAVRGRRSGGGRRKPAQRSARRIKEIRAMERTLRNLNTRPAGPDSGTG